MLACCWRHVLLVPRPVWDAKELRKLDVLSNSENGQMNTNKQTILNSLSNSLHALNDCIRDDLDNSEDVNEYVNSFTGILNEIVLSHCNVSIPTATSDGIRKRSIHNRKHVLNDTPWFDERRLSFEVEGLSECFV